MSQQPHQLLVIRGSTESHPDEASLIAALRETLQSGTLYLGYPILGFAEQRIDVNALLLTTQTGLISFQFADMSSLAADKGPEQLIAQQDSVYIALETYLGRKPTLRDGRKLALTINTVTLVPETYAVETRTHPILKISEIADYLKLAVPIQPELYRKIDSVLNQISNIQPLRKRANVTRQDSLGAQLKRIEREIANLDRWQKKAAIEVPNGIQRIRGLAGSGKTIVLALKAAHLHARHPEWKIVVTFYSRTLYAQLEALARRFSQEHLLDEPDWEQLQILHCWGSARTLGLYALIANHLGAPIRDWAYARDIHGAKDGDAFAGICQELLQIAKSKTDVSPLFDAVLIDEAQDLPQQFFELLRIFTKPPHRIIFAYDELQQLNAASMPSVERLFGNDGKGGRQIEASTEDSVNNDVVLPVCYRNPPWTLTLAHALGFGIYRENGLVQHFDAAQLWEEVGYQVNGGQLADGTDVTLIRSPASYPRFFETELHKSDCIKYESFASDEDMLEHLAKEVADNVHRDELQHDDILVVLPNAYTSKRRAFAVTRALQRVGINSHNVGEYASQDSIFQPNSIAITHIYRAKGNEAAMVYVLDAEHAVGDKTDETNAGLASRRNILFTAITRARAWVRIYGVGPQMDVLVQECNKTVTNDYQLKFRIPTAEDRKRLRQLHRDRAAAEAAKRKQLLKNLSNAVDLLPEDADPDLREKLTSALNSVRDEP